MQETRNYDLAFVNFSCGSAVLHETVSRSTPRKVNVQVGGMSLRWLIVKPKSCSNCSNYDFTGMGAFRLRSTKDKEIVEINDNVHKTSLPHHASNSLC